MSHNENLGAEGHLRGEFRIARIPHYWFGVLAVANALSAAFGGLFELWRGGLPGLAPLAKLCRPPMADFDRSKLYSGVAFDGRFSLVDSRCLVLRLDLCARRVLRAASPG